jgi:hypothetical protein
MSCNAEKADGGVGRGSGDPPHHEFVRIVWMEMRQFSSIFGHFKDGRRNRLPDQDSE